MGRVGDRWEEEEWEEEEERQGTYSGLSPWLLHVLLALLSLPPPCAGLPPPTPLRPLWTLLVLDRLSLRPLILLTGTAYAVPCCPCPYCRYCGKDCCCWWCSAAGLDARSVGTSPLSDPPGDGGSEDDAG